MIKTIEALMFCICFMQYVSAQVVVTVQTLSGTENAITLSNEGELQISDASLTVVANESTTYSFAIDDISKVLFDGSVNIRQVEVGPKISIYPNPTGQCFAVQGLADGVYNLSIYNASGALQLSTSYSPLEQVDISALPQGIYLVRVGTSVTKLIKQ